MTSRPPEEGHPHRRREEKGGKSLAVRELRKRYRRREVVKGVSIETGSG
jgi:hypothetical protein